MILSVRSTLKGKFPDIVVGRELLEPERSPFARVVYVGIGRLAREGTVAYDCLIPAFLDISAVNIGALALPDYDSLVEVTVKVSSDADTKNKRGGLPRSVVPLYSKLRTQLIAFVRARARRRRRIMPRSVT